MHHRDNLKQVCKQSMQYAKKVFLVLKCSILNKFHTGPIMKTHFLIPKNSMHVPIISLVHQNDFASLEQYETVWVECSMHKSFHSIEMVHSKHSSYCLNSSTSSPSPKELHVFTKELFSRHRRGCSFGLAQNRFVKIVCSMAKMFS